MIPLFGHDNAVQAFREQLAGGRLHQAWLVSGPKGVGKGLFARKAALRLLAEAAGPPPVASGVDVADEHPIARLMDAGSHPDLMLLERLPRESGGELARNITVDQVRGLQRLFSITPSMSPWRAVIIDSIDDLERGAANALLKNLEEPPANSIFFLVSHAPDQLLPTIRSRCRILRLGLLDQGAMTSALQAAVPEASESEVASLAVAGAGSPGRALAFRGLDIDSLDRTLAEIASRGDPSNGKRAKLAQELSLKAAQPRYEAFLDRVPSLIAREAHKRRGAPLAEAISLWERAHDLAGSATRLSLDPQSVVFTLAGMVAALAPTAKRDDKADG